jgi:AmpD protein
MEGSDETRYTPVQYEKLAAVSCRLMEVYPAINHARIVGHSDIAPGRKTDPGPAFDWPYFRKLLGQA